MDEPPAAPEPSRAERLLGLGRGELAPATCGFAFFFFLFCGYFMLRPLRETLGIQAGVDQLQWLFTATFAATLAVVPLFGWFSARAPRARLLTWIYGIFALAMAAFGAALHARPDSVWIARVFYVWLSVPMLYIWPWQAPELPPLRLISSMMMEASVRPRPEPPYSWGISAASQPASVSARTKSSG